jgi:hypothetical protein
MKRVKIMLTAITILTVVGGALAFKAKNSNVFCGIKGGIKGTSDCPLKIQTTFSTTTVGSLYCTVNGATCDTRAVTSIDL